MNAINRYISKLRSFVGPVYKTRLGGINAQTLILVRWVAVVGQLVAVVVVEFFLKFPLPLYYCLAAISVLAISNLFVGMNYPRRGRLKNYHAARIMAFDLAQLSALSYLTGGLNNPFSLLILVPVTVAATMLSRGAIIMLAVLSIFATTFLAFYHLPLPWPGVGLDLPYLYVLGSWAALAVTIVFTTVFLWSLTEESRRTIDALSETEAALAREQNLSALGGLAAAAAHELGSPLATIAVVAKELSKEVPEDSPLAEDVALLLSQTDRCRDILAGMARRPEEHGGVPFEKVPLTELMLEATLNHIPENISLIVQVDEATEVNEPIIPRKLEILQGLGNIIQNAGQFANKGVEIRLFWDGDTILIRIKDDGPGFPIHILNSLGDPYLSIRADSQNHMGLGVFIAQNLLERVGASIRYRNRNDGIIGAEVAIRWDRSTLEGNVNTGKLL